MTSQSMTSQKSQRVYLDHNATSPLRPEARSAMEAAFGLTGNASSIHSEGRSVRARIERAREQVAALVNANPKNVIFTGGGTEANMTALSPELVRANCPRNKREQKPHLFLSAIEHPCVLSGGRFAKEDITLIPVTADGVVDIEALEAQIKSTQGVLTESLPEGETGAPFIVSVMLANNETGAIQPIHEIAKRVHALGGLVHTDAVQAAGKIPVDSWSLGADLLTLSAHKMGGPQGVGALVLCADNIVVGAPLLKGGGQEMKRRAGTENLIGIAGFGAAAEQARQELSEIGRVSALRDQLEQSLKETAPDMVIFSQNASRLPNTTCFSVAGLTAERVLIALDLAGVAVSSGSACSSGKVDRSHVLQAMGIPDDLAEGAIRISLGWDTRNEDIARFMSAWTKIYEKFKADRVAA